MRLFVTVKGGASSNKALCIICRAELRVNWCQNLDSWVFEDAMRIDLGAQGEEICHEVCYNALSELENNA